MALLKETWQELAKRTGIEAEELQKIISSETEEQVELKPINIFSDDELEKIKINAKKEGTRDNLIFATEKLVKAFRDKNGLELNEKIKYTNDNMIDFDAIAENLSSTHKSKIESESNIEPDKKVKELESKYNTLKETYDKDVELKEKEISGYKSQVFNKNIDFYLSSTIPDNLPQGITKEDALLITKNRFKFDPSEDLNGFQLKDISGNPYQDKMGDIRPKNEVLAEFYTEKGWSQSEGRGAGDSKGGNRQFKDINEAMKHMEDNDINPHSDAGQKIIETFKN